MAMEAWEPNFVLSRRSIQKTVVWLKLLGLPMEYWVPTAILAIATEVGKPLSLDEFTNLLWKTGYTRVHVEIDTGKPLKPGVLIRGRKEAFWQ